MLTPPVETQLVKQGHTCDFNELADFKSHEVGKCV